MAKIYYEVQKALKMDADLGGNGYNLASMLDEECAKYLQNTMVLPDKLIVTGGEVWDQTDETEFNNLPSDAARDAWVRFCNTPTVDLQKKVTTAQIKRFFPNPSQGQNSQTVLNLKALAASRKITLARKYGINGRVAHDYVTRARALPPLA